MPFAEKLAEALTPDMTNDRSKSSSRVRKAHMIETGARMLGGPIVGFSGEATASSQADRLDYLTSIGIIALSGDRDQIFEDYQKIREMESKLQFTKT